MRTTLTIDDDLFALAEKLTGVHEKSALLRESLQALIERESARRLGKLGGSEPAGCRRGQSPGGTIYAQVS